MEFTNYRKLFRIPQKLAKYKVLQTKEFMSGFLTGSCSCKRKSEKNSLENFLTKTILVYLLKCLQVSRNIVEVGLGSEVCKQQNFSAAV